MSINPLNFVALRAAGLAAILAIAGCSEGNNNSAIEGPLIPAPEPTSADYELVWSDEFDGSGVDEANWEIETGDGSDADVGLPGWGNNEEQYYTASNITVADGNLVIEAREGDSPDAAYNYTSGRLRSQGKVDFTFGRIEASIKVPPGVGLWAAFWLLGTEPGPYGGWAAKGEIDILESFGGNDPFAQGALHYGMGFPQNQFVAKDYRDIDPTDGFHQYAVEWDVEQVRWYIDGVHYFTVRADSYWNYYFQNERDGFAAGGEAAPFDQNQHIIMNLAVGGNLPEDDPISSVFPAQMLVDYVRLYQCPIDPQNTGLGCQNSIDPVNPYIIAEIEEDDVFTAGYILYLDQIETLFADTGADRFLGLDVFTDGGALVLTEVATPDGGMALDLRTTGGGNVSIKDSEGDTFNVFGVGASDSSGFFGGEISFDIKVISGADTDANGMLRVKMDSGFPNTSFVEIPISELPQDQWGSRSVPITDILESNQGVDGGDPVDISQIVSLVTFEPTSAAHIQINNIQLKCGAPDACGITSFATATFDVFIDSVDPAWERGIGAYDSPADITYYEGDTGNHVTWELVDTGEAGHDIVVETTFDDSGASGLVFIGGPEDGSLDLSGFSDGELVFDARFIRNPNDLALVYKVDGPEFAGTGEQSLGQLVLNEWETFSIPVRTLVTQGLPLAEVTAVVLMPTFAGNDAVLQWDNMRFEPTSAGPTVPVGLPVDFETEGAFYTFSDFGGSATEVIDNPEPGGINTSAKVARFFKFEGEVYAGSTLLLDTPIDFAASEQITVSVWSPRPVDVLFKLEGANQELTVSHTGAGWEQLTFDFTGLTVAGELALTFIFDNGVVGDAEGDPDNWTFYVDDIALRTSGGTGGDGATGCDACTDFDDPGITYNFIDFGTPTGPMTVLTMDPLDAGNTVASTTKPLGASADSGTTLDSGTIIYPLSSINSKISLRIYSPTTGMPVRLRLQDASDPMRSVESEVVTTTSDAWETLVFDFSDPVSGTPALNPGYTYDQLSIFFNFGTDGNTGGELTTLWDTIEFIGDSGGIRYSADFESSDIGASEVSDGWLTFVQVFESDGITVAYVYGPAFATPNGTGHIAAIAPNMEGDVEQGLQYLNLFSDYNNADHGVGRLINPLTFQQRTIGADDGALYRLSFQAKAPFTGGIAAPTTAQAFIKTLDPENGFATTSIQTLDLSMVSNSEWVNYEVLLLVDAGALEGQILQFGFENTATGYNDSGIYYDNIVFEPAVNTPFSYETDFEASDIGASEVGDGWLTFVQVFESDGITVAYVYGPAFETPNGTGHIAAIAPNMEGDVEQGLQYLNLFSDYNNADHGVGRLINPLTFQERTISAGTGGLYRLSFQAKAPFTGGIAAPTTAQAFIKTLDPEDGFSTTNLEVVELSMVSNSEWVSYEVLLMIDADELDGQILQFGFENTATGYNDSGIYYDNINFGLAP
ncbi:glycoside hydrolase family 16 protein [Candidatus Litorirhabdus singularis]|uniref:glycoside hydrolase family 16 protein n=1 Tax=Candidatus Litorirhabdus singularis TaxID=2518993 RepID=UPI00242A7EA8|nr:glycoside hydrolase family 16 protein [Candidatus Litorirhabdus singularis]